MNSNRIIIFQELLGRYPELPALLTALGLTPVPVSGGKEALSKVWELQPSVVLLDVAMPQLSGIETCRQIKERKSFAGTKVILVSDVQTPTVKERAEGAGCDLYLAQEEALGKIQEFLAPFAPSAGEPASESLALTEAPPLSVSDIPAKVAAYGPVEVIVDGQTKQGELINLSRSGVLIALGTVVSAGTKVGLKFGWPGDPPASIRGAVAKVVELTEPRHGLLFATGVKFSELTKDQLTRIVATMARFFETALRSASLDPMWVDRIVSSKVADLIAVALDKDPKSPLSFLGPLTEFERVALGSEEIGTEHVRRTVALRIKLGVLATYAPRILADPGVMADPFLLKVGPLLSQTAEIEEEIEKQVKQAVAARDETQRRGLNETATRLHNAEVELAEKASGLGNTGLGTEALRILEDLRSRIALLREPRPGGITGIQYGRRSGKQEEKKPEPEVRGKKNKSAWIGKAIAAAIVALGGGGIYLIVDYTGRRVERTELSLSIPLDSAEREENGLVIHTKALHWEQTKGEARDQVFTQTEAYMKKYRLRQAKIVDENERILAAITVGGAQGMELTYARRIYLE
ncbi:MAG: response regulator [Pseudomonadota bacterium]